MIIGNFVYVCLGMLQEIENFEREDQAADEWRAREIANDIAKRKVRQVQLSVCAVLCRCHFLNW